MRKYILAGIGVAAAAILLNVWLFSGSRTNQSLAVSGEQVLVTLRPIVNSTQYPGRNTLFVSMRLSVVDETGETAWLCESTRFGKGRTLQEHLMAVPGADFVECYRHSALVGVADAFSVDEVRSGVEQIFLRYDGGKAPINVRERPHNQSAYAVVRDYL